MSGGQGGKLDNQTVSVKLASQGTSAGTQWKRLLSCRGVGESLGSYRGIPSPGFGDSVVVLPPHIKWPKDREIVGTLKENVRRRGREMPKEDRNGH